MQRYCLESDLNPIGPSVTELMLTQNVLQQLKDAAQPCKTYQQQVSQSALSNFERMGPPCILTCALGIPQRKHFL